MANEETENTQDTGAAPDAESETASQEGTAAAATVVLTEDAGDLDKQYFLEEIRKCKHHGCATEKDVPCDLYTAMSAEVVEYQNGKWVPTGNIVDNTERWGVRVRFGYWGKLARCLTGDIDMTLWWDGFGNLPEGSKGHRIAHVDPCQTRHQFIVVIEMSGVLYCPRDAGVYDVGVTLTFGCCGKPIIHGFCDLHGINVHC